MAVPWILPQAPPYHSQDISDLPELGGNWRIRTWFLSLKSTVQNARLNLDGTGMQWFVFVYFEGEQGHFGRPNPKTKTESQSPFPRCLVSYESPSQWPLGPASFLVQQNFCQQCPLSGGAQARSLVIHSANQGFTDSCSLKNGHLRKWWQSESFSPTPPKSMY